jgi:hypothetical protein
MGGELLGAHPEVVGQFVFIPDRFAIDASEPIGRLPTMRIGGQGEAPSFR